MDETNTNDSVGEYFESLAKYMEKSNDQLNRAWSVVSQPPSIRKIYISDKFLFCPNFKPRKHIENAFYLFKTKKHIVQYENAEKY